MYNQKGSMREIDDGSPRPSRQWDNESELNYQQKSKYEKSEVSYKVNTKGPYDQSKIDRNGFGEEKIKIVPVKVKSLEHDTDHHFEDLIIELKAVNDRTNSYISLHITSKTNPLFLWNFMLRDSEFSAFKASECLKVDFQKFPEVILSLLDRCLNMRTYSAYFEIQKGGEEAGFRIYEDNEFNECKHLLLKFKKANDEQAKLFFSQKYDQEQRENFRLNSQLNEVQSKLTAKLEEFSQLWEEKEKVEKQKSEKIEELERNEREKIEKLLLKKEEEHIGKEREETDKNKRKVDELNNKIEEVKSKYEDVYNKYQKENEKVINLEANVKSLEAKALALSQQCENYERQNKELKEKDFKIGEDYHNLKNENTKFACTIESLQDKLKEKDGRIAESSEVKVNSINQICVLEENLRQEKKKVEKLEEKIDNLEEELSKGKKKNEDLEKKSEKRKDKLAEYKQIITIQEQTLNDQQKQNTTMLQDIVKLKRDLENAEREINDRDIKIHDLKSRLTENTDQIEEKKKLIARLNKELSDRTFGQTTTPILPNTYTIPKFTSYSSYTASGSTGRGDLLSNTESRLKYSPSPISKSPMQGAPRVVETLPFKKYTREGVENEGDQENSRVSTHSTHSRSPHVERLSQQLDPEEMDKTREKIAPIKFKK